MGEETKGRGANWSEFEFGRRLAVLDGHLEIVLVGQGAVVDVGDQHAVAHHDVELVPAIVLELLEVLVLVAPDEVAHLQLRAAQAEMFEKMRAAKSR